MSDWVAVHWLAEDCPDYGILGAKGSNLPFLRERAEVHVAAGNAEWLQKPSPIAAPVEQAEPAEGVDQ